MGIIWFAYFITDLMKLNQISIGSPRSWETCFLPNPVASWDKAKRGGTPSVSVCHLPFVLPCHCGCKATSLMCCVMRFKEAAKHWCQGSHLQTSGREDSKGSASSGGSLLLVMGRMLSTVLCLLSFRISQLWVCISREVRVFLRGPGGIGVEKRRRERRWWGRWWCLARVADGNDSK